MVFWQLNFKQTYHNDQYKNVPFFFLTFEKVFTYPVHICLFKVNNRNTRRSVKTV